MWLNGNVNVAGRCHAGRSAASVLLTTQGGRSPLCRACLEVEVSGAGRRVSSGRLLLDAARKSLAIAYSGAALAWVQSSIRQPSGKYFLYFSSEATMAVREML